MPILAIGLAATAIGTGLSMAGNRQAQDAVDEQRKKYAAEQDVLQKSAKGVFQNSVTQSGADASGATLAKGAASRSAIANALINSSAPASGPLPSNDQPGYQVTGGTSAADRANVATNAWSNVVNGAANKIGSYGDLQTQQGIEQSNAANQLNVTNSKARGNANLLPLELEVAGHKGDALSGWGKIVSALGSVASMGAASGIGAGATAATTAGQAATAATGMAAGVAPWTRMAQGMAPKWQF